METMMALLYISVGSKSCSDSLLEVLRQGRAQGQYVQMLWNDGVVKKHRCYEVDYHFTSMLDALNSVLPPGLRAEGYANFYVVTDDPPHEMPPIKVPVAGWSCLPNCTYTWGTMK